MKWRNRKKAFDCAHHVYESFLVTDDPYPIYNTEDYCKLGKFDLTWARPSDDPHPCESCKKFCASRVMIRKQREDKARMKEWLSECQKAEKIAFKLGILQKDSSNIRDLILDDDLPF